MKLDNNNQYELSYIYHSAQSRMSANKEFAENQMEILNKYDFLKTEEEALDKAKLCIKNDSFKCQVWAKIEKDEEYYHLSDKWITTEDWQIKDAAEYLGFALVYSNSDLHKLFEKKNDH